MSNDFVTGRQNIVTDHDRCTDHTIILYCLKRDGSSVTLDFGVFGGETDKGTLFT